MKTLMKACLLGSTMLGFFSTAAYAQDMHAGHASHLTHRHNGASVPVSIMGDHTHNRGEWMLSYRASRMYMEGNRRGTDGLSPTEIVSTLANPHAPPANVRVVPLKMEMDMHMIGAMYGLTDNVTLMGMAMYMNNEMDHITFAGMAGTTERGRFTTRSRGWGDTQIGAIYKVYKEDSYQINAGLNIGIPTGSIKEQDQVLTPMNTRPTLRLPYAMQLGSGTWDALPSITYSGHKEKWSWGAQYKAALRLESENSQGYRLGHEHAVSIWSGYQLTHAFSVNMRLSGEHSGKIKGEDANITAPVQTANPDNYGGKMIDAAAGFVYAPQNASLNGLEFAMEVAVPVYQNLNGVQMERERTVSMGLTYRF